MSVTNRFSKLHEKSRAIGVMHSQYSFISHRKQSLSSAPIRLPWPMHTTTTKPTTKRNLTPNTSKTTTSQTPPKNIKSLKKKAKRMSSVRLELTTFRLPKLSFRSYRT
ncbi:hypothetical protein CI102_10568 [Trichoderma harzianum]|nr:hypothetical protein CI102_10568 [Trichoderma harzianum]